ncbi:hypothetical protein [Actinomadura sediminis]|uniref:Uncharacterized protein n=1 Tax=Actinomadura sediminis TaxID=1038904 RepID=A0ABW3EJ25_9ACTN
MSATVPVRSGTEANDEAPAAEKAAEDAAEYTAEDAAEYAADRDPWEGVPAALLAAGRAYDTDTAGGCG